MAPEQLNAVGLLEAWTAGDERALELLIPLVYGELRRLARSYLRQERRDHTLQTTALVHEAYLHLVGQREVDWHDRNQLLGLAAHMMRRVLLKHAEARNTAKRGGAQRRLSLSAAMEMAADGDGIDIDVIALDAALEDLETLDPRQSRIVELRYYGGLKVQEIADVVGVSPATVKRELQTARMWLRRQIDAQ